MKTKVNRPKLAKETSSGSTHLFQRTSPTTSVNISFFLIQKHFPNNSKYHKIFNKNNVKINYSCMANMKKYTTEPAKAHLNSAMENIRNRSIMKNIGQVQNFRRNTGDLKNSKHNLKYNFTFQKDADQQKEQVFVI